MRNVDTNDCEFCLVARARSAASAQEGRREETTASHVSSHLPLPSGRFHTPSPHGPQGSQRLNSPSARADVYNQRRRLDEPTAQRQHRCISRADHRGLNERQWVPQASKVKFSPSSASMLTAPAERGVELLLPETRQGHSVFRWELSAP